MINLLADKIEKLNTTIDIVQCLEYFDFKRNHSSEYFLIYKIFNNEYLIFKNNDGALKIVDLSNLEYINLFEVLLLNSLLSVNIEIVEALNIVILENDKTKQHIFKRTSLRICIAILSDFDEYINQELGLFRRNDKVYPYAIKLQGRSNSKAMKDIIIFNNTESHSLFKNGSSILNRMSKDATKVHIMFNPYFLIKNREELNITDFIVLNKNSKSFDYNHSALDIFSIKKEFILLINERDVNIWFNVLYLFNYFLNQILNK
ncbi:MAG: hypothetical protein JKY54_03660, partial [Flavobacteriales bacterium]|nr:hypothetical protein [Flavobacteriales bacterium]